MVLVDRHQTSKPCPDGHSFDIQWLGKWWRRGRWGDGGQMTPSVLHFKQGRGLEVKRAPSISLFEGGRGLGVVGRRRAPSISCFE